MITQEINLDFSRSRKDGAVSAVIGRKGQQLRHLSLRADDFCSVKLYTEEIRTMSQRVLDRLAGRDGKVLLGDFTLHSTITRVNLFYQLPIELTVIGGKGILNCIAFIDNFDRREE